MNNIILTIFIGVLSGILTSILIWIAIKTVRNILIPWYQQTIYRGINISGIWTAKHEFVGGVVSTQILEISQKGHSIKGTLISNNKSKSREEETAYYFISGEIFDNFVDIEYNIRDKKYIGRGSLLLKVKNGGDTLEGGVVAIERFSTEVISVENLKWIRKK